MNLWSWAWSWAWFRRFCEHSPWITRIPSPIFWPHHQILCNLLYSLYVGCISILTWNTLISTVVGTLALILLLIAVTSWCVVSGLEGWHVDHTLTCSIGWKRGLLPQLSLCQYFQLFVLYILCVDISSSIWVMSRGSEPWDLRKTVIWPWDFSWLVSVLKCSVFLLKIKINQV